MTHTTPTSWKAFWDSPWTWLGLSFLEIGFWISTPAGGGLRWLYFVEFLTKLKSMGENWRCSDEFIGIIVRMRYPRDYENKDGS